MKTCKLIRQKILISNDLCVLNIGSLVKITSINDILEYREMV